MQRKNALLLGLGLTAAMVSSVFFMCGSGKDKAGAEKKREITVISREESSGTRGAFDELMKITDGKTNMLFAEAVIVSSTDEAASKVEVDKNAIGYTSLGSVTSKVKALSIDGVEAKESNVKSGSYKISRPFVVAMKSGSAHPLAQDFIRFITSKPGQEVVAKAGYITLDDFPEYAPAAGVTGKVTLSGSTSVEKVMEKLKEKYLEINAGAKIEINYNGSSAGIKDCLSAKSDIAMSSRELKAEEKEQLDGKTFALDGIAVVVNPDNALNEISSETVTKIFKGEVRYWEDL
ncbi:MAG: substrate-binding domain-containing protein [Chitinispirillales bacterium]|jgi:phosphate transport system substrate-binding protein|nr:substrate-binding domain-containing protein [Chitinispirillales bacterium]